MLSVFAHVPKKLSTLPLPLCVYALARADVHVVYDDGLQLLLLRTHLLAFGNHREIR